MKRAPGRRVFPVLIFMASGTPAWAAPDFSDSAISISTQSPHETDIVEFSIVLRNSGPDDAESVYFTTEWPLMGFLTGTTGFSAAEVDHASRKLTMSLPLAAGEERRFGVSVLAPRDSGGDVLTLAIRAAHFDSGTEHWDTKSVDIETRIPNSGITVGSLHVTRAGVVTLSVLGGLALVWLLLWRLAVVRLSRPRARLFGPGMAASAVTIALGFWAMFGAMAQRDYQSLRVWPETTCTILGGRLSAQTTTRTRREAGEFIDDTNYVPVLGLKYRVNGHDTYSSGFDTGSRLGIGGQGGRARELAQWSVGDTTPCWYNPDDVTDVVVLRGFGGAYLFALLPLPLFLIGLTRLRSLAK